LQEHLEGHTWILDGSSSTPSIDAGGRSVTIVFRDETVSGRGPCNTYGGPVAIGAEEIAIGSLAVTLMACEDRLMSAERAYFDALAAVSRAEVNDDDHRLTLAGDGVELRYRSYDAGELLAGEWQIVSVATGDAITSAVAGTEPAIIFRDNGDVRLVTGCNDGSGSWTLDGNDLGIGPLRQTRKFCTEPPGVMEQETALTAALDAAARIEITPGDLTILDANGSIVLVAVKHA
jgi:heat shock protein HslJ